MHAEFWLSRWEEGRTGFHREDVHADLIRFEDRFLGDGPHRVLVPLCGKTLDLAWLASRGHTVVGVELSPVAAAALFEQAGLTPTKTEDGPFTRWTAGSITILQGDVFEATPERVGPIDRIWDRAAIVALDPPRRERYAATVRALLPSGGLILQNAFAYDQSQMDGPPFAVPEDEIAAHYAGWDRTLLLRENPIEGKFAERGIVIEISRYLLRKP